MSGSVCLKKSGVAVWSYVSTTCGSGWVQVEALDLQMFREPDQLPTRYREVVLTLSITGTTFQVKPV